MCQMVFVALHCDAQVFSRVLDMLIMFTVFSKTPNLL